MGDAPFDVIFAVRRGGGATGMPMKSTIFWEAATKKKEEKEKKKKKKKEEEEKEEEEEEKKTTTGRIHPSGMLEAVKVLNSKASMVDGGNLTFKFAQGKHSEAQTKRALRIAAATVAARATTTATVCRCRGIVTANAIRSKGEYAEASRKGNVAQDENANYSAGHYCWVIIIITDDAGDNDDDDDDARNYDVVNDDATLRACR
ncbi:hypothetical protein V1478_011878 [Vespula squamosa]|uniref:Uncharacterized protein n=1 Tax=Vespula squamosa TaxID=30214 RepID=A0ABD2ABM2_VESSQ